MSARWPSSVPCGPVKVDAIAADIAAHHWTGALISALTLLAALAAQGKLQPLLARMSPWQKTLALLAIVQAGIAAQSYAAGLGVAVAVMRAVPPLVVLVLAHYAAPSEPAKGAAASGPPPLPDAPKDGSL